MTKVITCFSVKGGVSKTTTLYNLAVYLTQNNKRVLIVDCDPQCNISNLFFASMEPITDPSKELPGTSIYEAIEPRIQGITAQADAHMIELAESEYYRNLFLLRGDIELATAERYLSVAWDYAITESIHDKMTYIFLYNLFHSLGRLYSFDYILCDAGSSLSAITRMVVLACDGYFLSLSPDRFSNSGIYSLSRDLCRWIERHADISRTFEPYYLSSFPGKPILLGAILQDFEVYNDGELEVYYKKWLDVISKSIKTQFISTNILPVSEKLDPDNPFIAYFENMGPLASISQIYGLAIFDIRKEQTAWATRDGREYYGVAWQFLENKMIGYKKEIEKIAEALP